MLRTGALGVGALAGMSAVDAATSSAEALAPTSVQGSVDAFLKIDGIPGDRTDDQHKDTIEVLSFSWGASSTPRVTLGGTLGIGKVTLQDFSFAAFASKASPLLFASCAKGSQLKSAQLFVRSAGEQQQEFYRIDLKDLLVSSYQTSGSSESPMDQVSLHYASLTFTYSPQGPDGSLESPIVGTYP
jgi:type VI secretion system secreted protein Hcp